MLSIYNYRVPEKLAKAGLHSCWAMSMQRAVFHVSLLGRLHTRGKFLHSHKVHLQPFAHLTVQSPCLFMSSSNYPSPLFSCDFFSLYQSYPR